MLADVKLNILFRKITQGYYYLSYSGLVVINITKSPNDYIQGLYVELFKKLFLGQTTTIKAVWTTGWNGYMYVHA